MIKRRGRKTTIAAGRRWSKKKTATLSLLFRALRWLFSVHSHPIAKKRPCLILRGGTKREQRVPHLCGRPRGDGTMMMAREHGAQQQTRTRKKHLTTLTPSAPACGSARRSASSAHWQRPRGTWPLRRAAVRGRRRRPTPGRSRALP